MKDGAISIRPEAMDEICALAAADDPFGALITLWEKIRGEPLTACTTRIDPNSARLSNEQQRQLIESVRPDWRFAWAMELVDRGPAGWD